MRCTKLICFQFVMLPCNLWMLLPCGFIGPEAFCLMKSTAPANSVEHCTGLSQNASRLTLESLTREDFIIRTFFR
jgi:hypothetical protein